MKSFSLLKSFLLSPFRFLLKRKFLSFLLILFSVGTFLTIDFFFSLPDTKGFIHGIPRTTAMIDQRKKESSLNGKRLRIRKRWVPLSIIPSFLKRTVIVSEDINFFSHKGIDYYELKEAIKKNLKTGKRSRGGSTITQQLAKNLFLSTKKSYLRKLKEFFIAGRLEKHLSKNRIFELYLNVIEFGRGIFGVEAASEFFFKKRVERLNKTEMIRLVSVIPKPLRVSPLSNSGYLKWRANLLIDRLYKSNSINKKVYNTLKISFM